MPADLKAMSASELEKLLDAADALNADLCDGKRTWRMSIPVQPDDTDVVFGNATNAGHELARRLSELERENAELRGEMESLRYQHEGHP